MNLYLVGPLDGKILRLYATIPIIEKETGIRCDWILCTGSLGAWLDPQVLDPPTRKHDGPGDFAELYLNQWRHIPPLSFVSGPHEDHLWLNRRRFKPEIMPGCFWIPNGTIKVIDPDQLRVTGLGGVYSRTTYRGRPGKKEARQYKRVEAQRANSLPTDILLTHEGPQGERFGSVVSEAEGIRNILHDQSPRLGVHSGYGTSRLYTYHDTLMVALKKHEIRVAQVTDQKVEVLNIRGQVGKGLIHQ